MTDREFQDKVLEELGAIKADIRNLCKGQDENSETHANIFTRLNAQEVAVAAMKERTGIIGMFFGLVGGVLAGIVAWLTKG
jgi:hypothetical protein